MAANDTSAISLDQLKTVANSLEEQRQAIYNTYNQKVKKVLTSSQQCFQVAGLDFSQIESSFNTTFNTVNTNLQGLVLLLNNDVIRNYSEVSEALKKLFNTDLAKQLESLLSIASSSSSKK